MKIQQILVTLCVACAPFQQMSAGIFFGSDDSKLLVEEGVINLGDAADLSGGTLQVISSETGSITVSEGGSAMADNVRYQVGSGAYRSDVTLQGSTDLYRVITLGNEGQLNMTGGVIYQRVDVESTDGAPASIRGYGEFANDIYMNAAGADSSVALTLDMHSVMKGDIYISAPSAYSYIYLYNDLTFAPGSCIAADSSANGNYVYFNYHTMTVGDTSIEGNQYWYNANIEVSADSWIVDNTVITFQGGTAFLNGNGNTIYFGDNARFEFFTDIHLQDVRLYMLNNTAMSDSEQMRVNNVQFARYGQMITVEYGDIYASNIFDNEVWISDAYISLNSDMTFANPWYCTGGSTVVGNGKTLDLTTAGFYLYSDLSLSDMTLRIGQDSFAAGGGDLTLANMTVVLTEDVDWLGYNFSLYIGSDVTVITNGHSWNGPETEGPQGYIQDVTLWVDDLGLGTSSISGFQLLGNGRIAMIDASASGGSVTFTDDVSATQNQYLYPYDDVDGRTLTFDASGGTITYDGNGRSIVFPVVDLGVEAPEVFFVESDSTVVMQHVVMDGLLPDDHLSFTGESLVRFGNQTTIKLGASTSLDQSLFFGSSTSASYESMTLDLCGHTLDITNGSFTLIADVEFGGSTLTIKNGSLIGLADSNFTIGDNSSVVFEDVSLTMISDCNFAQGNIVFQGYCHLYGAYTFEFSSSRFLRIPANSHLTLHDGVTYYHSSTSAHRFDMHNKTSVLELIGASFVRADSEDWMLMYEGTIIVDHKATFVPGTGGLVIAALGDETVDFVIRPGAQIAVSGGGMLDLSYVD